MLAFVVEGFAFLLELAFGSVFELANCFFFPDFAATGAERKPSDRNSEDWFMPRILGLTVFLSILISGLWVSYLNP